MSPQEILRPIGLITDFGHQDWYVAAMKGEILKRLPGARIIDLFHSVSVHNVESAAFMLGCLLKSLPGEMVVCCVIDPGVGTKRRALCGGIAQRFYVGPDNGLMTPMILGAGKHVCLHEIRNASFRSSKVSCTFHGRDIFAHAAACLASGVPPDRAGPAVDDPVLFGNMAAEVRPGFIAGRVMHVDHFGNLLTNIDRDQVGTGPDSGQYTIRVGNLHFDKISLTYDEVEQDEALAYWGSAGYLEIGINLSSAADMTGLKSGSHVTIAWND